MHGKLSVGADDKEQLLRQMPKDYWLRGGPTKFILACMVHQYNKEITTSCSSLPAGQSREVQRNNAAARVSAERAAVKKAHKKQDDEDLRVRRIHANIGKMSLIKSRNHLVATQLQLYNNNKGSFIAAMGQEA
jgi:hypothetical protein